MEIVDEVGWPRVVAGGSLKGETCRDRHPTVAALLAIPPGGIFGGRSRPGGVALSQADLGDPHQCAGNFDLVAVGGEHLQGATAEQFSVVEEAGVGEHLGVVGMDLGQVAVGPGGDVAGFGFLELGDRRREVALQHAEVTEIVMGGRHDERLPEVLGDSDRLTEMTIRRAKVADLTEHCAEGDPGSHFAGAVTMSLQRTARRLQCRGGLTEARRASTGPTPG